MLTFLGKSACYVHNRVAAAIRVIKYPANIRRVMTDICESQRNCCNRETARHLVSGGIDTGNLLLLQLARPDQLKKQQDTLEGQLLEGLASGKERGFSKEGIAALKKTIFERSENSVAVE